jgi:hypothetical protein
VYKLAAYGVDWFGSWIDHKWGYQFWLRDRIAEIKEMTDTPCERHHYSTEDPACPYLHADQSNSPV